MNKPDPMYCDAGDFKATLNGKSTRVYNVWHHMRYRCYKADREKRYHSYRDCEVSEEFHSFQRFARWASSQIGLIDGFDLDKDLLLKGNRIYSPDTCLFLPSEINRILIKNKDKRTNMPVGIVHRPGHVTGKPFLACVNKGGKSIYLGYFQATEQAFAAYKIAKEKILRDVAEKYRTVIDPIAYHALMAYQVEITD